MDDDGLRDVRARSVPDGSTAMAEFYANDVLSYPVNFPLAGTPSNNANAVVAAVALDGKAASVVSGGAVWKMGLP
jgi:hypothetical protein